MINGKIVDVDDSEMSSLPPILTSIVVAILLIFLVLGFVAVRRIKQFKGIRELTLEEVNEFLFGNHGLVSHVANDLVVHADGLEFPSTFQIQSTDLNIDIQKILGEGQHGLCVSGKFQNQHVAVKMTKSSMDVESFKDFLREVKVMAFVGHHENIVHFFGAVVDRICDRICVAVMELSPFGDLRGYLRSNVGKRNSYINVGVSEGSVSWTCNSKRTQLTLGHLCYFCEQIAAAMHFVGSKKVIHGDLAARNVLVFPNYVVKITDFGLSRTLYNSANYKMKHETPLPWRWMAVESLKHLEFTYNSDVWSFGVTAWEIFSMGEVPFGGLTYSQGFANQLENGLRLPPPIIATDKITQFLNLCWNRIPMARPTFSNAALFFQRMRCECSETETMMT